MGTTTRGNEALLVIDMQRDFCDEGSPLCVAGAMDCLPQVEDAVRHARSRNIPVVWIVREHHATGCDVERFRRGCTGGSRPLHEGHPGGRTRPPAGDQSGRSQDCQDAVLGIPSHKPGTPAPGRARRRLRGPGRRTEPQLHSRHGHGRRSPRFPLSCCAQRCNGVRDAGSPGSQHARSSKHGVHGD
jgi:hypothetical protein